MINVDMLKSFAENPNDFETNYKLGKEYEKTYQYSSAIGFLLRAADRANTEDDLYNSLVSVAFNMLQQKDNLRTAESILKRICYFKKDRPEGWYFLCMINKLLKGSVEDQNNYMKLLVMYSGNEKGLYFIDYVAAANLEG
jgi:hypothetical protein